MHLHLIEGWAVHDDAFQAGPGVPAVERSCRPGLALAGLELQVDTHEVVRIERGAADAGVTRELWTAVAIESSRALAEISDALALDRPILAQWLDAAATDHIDHRSNDELAVYARQLRSATPRPLRTVRHDRLALSLSTHTLRAWARTAAAQDQPVMTWAIDRLKRADEAPLAWEAASAACGWSLGEWVSVQAARAAMRRSSVAQARP